MNQSTRPLDEYVEAEVQRMKSEGDYAAARAFFETHGVHFDPVLRDEVVERVDRLKLPSYTDFVKPKLEPLYAPDGAIVEREVAKPHPPEIQ